MTDRIIYKFMFRNSQSTVYSSFSAIYQNTKRGKDYIYIPVMKQPASTGRFARPGILFSDCALCCSIIVGTAISNELLFEHFKTQIISIITYID